VSDKDAQDFADFLAKQKGLFRNVYVSLLINQQATRSAIEKELYYKLRVSGKDDTVIVFLSGHGADDPKTPGEFFFLTYDSDPDFLAATALHMNRQWFLNKLESRRVLLLADSCHAGGFSGHGTKSSPISIQKFVEQFRESEGRVFISSSRYDERSYEKAEFGNSLFTHYLIEGLKGDGDADRDGVVTLKELYEYVYSKAKYDSKGLQHPQMEGRIVGTFPLSLAPNRPTSQTRSHQLEKPTPSSATPDSLDEVKIVKLRAENGESEAQFELGLRHEFGLNLPKNREEAMKWYEKAREQGHEAAKQAVERLRGGRTASRVTEQPLKPTESEKLSGKLRGLFQEAENGYASAQFELGNRYLNGGEGLSKNYMEAIRWYRKAADQEHTDAQFNLAQMYEDGTGVKKNMHEAVKWYTRSAEQGFAESQYRLGQIYMSHPIFFDRNLAERWLTKAARQGHKKAEDLLAVPGAFRSPRR
jgi:TPR repeat protein